MLFFFNYQLLLPIRTITFEINCEINVSDPCKLVQIYILCELNTFVSSTTWWWQEINKKPSNVGASMWRQKRIVSCWSQSTCGVFAVAITITPSLCRPFVVVIYDGEYTPHSFEILWNSLYYIHAPTNTCMYCVHNQQHINP